jgi:plasmid maintenance system antidote protein VapI
MAVRLSKAFGGTPESWLGIQFDHDLAKVLRRAGRIKVKRVGRLADA